MPHVVAAPFSPIGLAAIESFERLRITLAHNSAHTMASLLKSQTLNASKAAKKGKRKADDMDVDEITTVQPKQKKNKQRVLMLSSRGVTHRMRHLMNDLETLLPHIKKGIT